MTLDPRPASPGTNVPSRNRSAPLELSNSAATVAVSTDSPHTVFPSPDVRRPLDGCRTLVLESNIRSIDRCHRLPKGETSAARDADSSRAEPARGAPRRRGKRAHRQRADRPPRRARDGQERCGCRPGSPRRRLRRLAACRAGRGRCACQGPGPWRRRPDRPGPARVPAQGQPPAGPRPHADADAAQLPGARHRRDQRAQGVDPGPRDGDPQPGAPSPGRLRARRQARRSSGTPASSARPGRSPTGSTPGPRSAAPARRPPTAASRSVRRPTRWPT